METMPMIPVSWGEVIDKVTILQIKAKNIAAPAALGNVRKELEALLAIVEGEREIPAGLEALAESLLTVNQRLWNLEDRIRAKERKGEFDAGFVEAARAIYVENDERARIKRAINSLTGSALVEEKSYDK